MSKHVPVRCAAVAILASALVLLCLPPPVASAQDQQIAIFPQIADGRVSPSARYAAEVEIQNSGDTAFTATVEFFDANGQPTAFEFSLLSRSAAPQTGGTFQFEVPAKTLQILRGGTGNYAARSGWCRISMGASGKASVTYAVTPVSEDENSLRQNIPLTRVTVLPASLFDRAAIPIVQDLGGARLGIAAANNSTSPINGTAAVFNENGQTVGSFAIQIGPFGQFLKFVDEAIALPQNFRGSLHIVWNGTSVEGYVVGLILYPNGTLATVPVAILLGGFGGGPPTDIFPHTADGFIPGASYAGQIVLVNGDSRDVQAVIEIFDDEGRATQFNYQVVGVAAPEARSLFQVTVPARGVRIMRGGNTTLPARSGWVRLRYPVAFFEAQVDFLVFARPATNAVPLTQVSVQRSFRPGVTRPQSLSIVQDTGGRLGFAIVNSSSTAIAGSAIVQDDSGQAVGSFPLNIPPMGRLIDFVDQRIPLPAQFRGRLLLNWPALGPPTFDQAGSAVGLLQYSNGVLAAVP